MEFRILGPLEVLENGQPLPITGAKQRALLALLLLERNRVVSADRLIDELWADESPDSRRNALQARISQLRKTLPDGVLVTRAPGYVITLEPGELDLSRFEELVGRARRAHEGGDIEESRSLLDEGLRLWRGPPLQDISLEGFVDASVGRLEELHIAALEERNDCDLALGRHTDLVPELRLLVQEHPLRERFREQLMLALYRSGRQAEALATYRDARRALVEGLGIEPGRRLQQLEREMLVQAPSLQLPGHALKPETPAEEPPSGRRRRRRLVAGGLGATAVLLGVVFALALRPDGTANDRGPVQVLVTVPRSFVGMVRIDPHTDKVVQRVPLPGVLREGSGTFAAGSMWIAGSTGVVRVDPESGRIIARIPVTGGGAGIAGSEEEGIWLTSHAPEENVVWQIDARVNAVVRRVHLPDHPYAGPWIGEGFVWLASTNMIWKLDPARGKIVAYIPYNIPTRATNNIAAVGEGALWIADPEGLAPGQGLHFGVVVRIDARTNELTQIHVPRVDGITVGGGAVWARSGVAGELTGTGDVTEINPTTNRVIQTIKLGHADWIEAWRDAVWVDNATNHTVVRINPATGEVVTRIVLPKTAKAIGEAAGLFWVAVWPD